MSTLEQIHQVIPAYFAGKPVDAVYLFGSHARGEATEDSDIDLLIHLDRSQPGKIPFHQWQEELQALFQCHVDIISYPERPDSGSRWAFHEKAVSEQRLLYTVAGFEKK